MKLIELSNIMEKVVNMVQLCSFVDFCLILGYYIHVLGIQYFRLNMLDNKIQNPTQFIINWSWHWQRGPRQSWNFSNWSVCRTSPGSSFYGGSKDWILLTLSPTSSHSTGSHCRFSRKPLQLLPLHTRLSHLKFIVYTVYITHFIYM